MIVNRKHEWELHCHSRFSDGQLTCPDLFALAVTNGVRHMALTDHDTAAGYRAALANAWVPAELELYPAAELSCVWKGRTIHMVGLGIDAYSERWLSIENDYVERRENRFLRILHVMRKAGFELKEERIRAIAPPGPPARPHVAAYLVETEQAKNTAQLYKRWLGQGKIGDVKSQWPEMAEAAQWILECGGLPVVAHPHRYDLTWTKTREMLDDFCAAGGQAIEIACVGLNPEKRKFLSNQAQERNLYASGGSDFHSPNTPWLKLGTYPEWPKDLPTASDWLRTRMATLKALESNATSR